MLRFATLLDTRANMSTSDPRVLRAQVIRAIRQFFYEQGFVETDTPSLVVSPGMEPHIRPIRVAEHETFLPTSPEFAMKRLLSQGYDRIFQVCKAYRDEPLSTTHNPEFTMLEWYRAHSGYEAIMDDVENMFVAIANKVDGLHVSAKSVTRPWQRLSVEECFRRFAGLELTELFDVKVFTKVCVEKGFAPRDCLDRSALDSPGVWDDLFFRVMLNTVEPGLAQLGGPAIVYNYPESQAALSNIFTDSRGFRWAKRFEVYAGGFELGNAFDELVDPAEQRRRFKKDMELRQRLYGDAFPPNPIDEEFLRSLENMPPSGGIAMGVDRIVMYFTGANSINDVLWLPSFYKRNS